MNTKLDLCDLCNCSGATPFVEVPTPMPGIPYITIRICPQCRHTLLSHANSALPVHDTVLRALGTLLDIYKITDPLPSSDAAQVSSAGAKPEVGPQA